MAYSHDHYTPKTTFTNQDYYTPIPVTAGSVEGPSPSLLVAETVTLIVVAADESQMERGKLTSYIHTPIPQAELVTDKELT
jgi:hypothetical protein